MLFLARPQLILSAREGQTWRAFVRRTRKPSNPVPLARDQRLLLRPRPSFDPTLKGECVITSRHRFAPDKLDRTPAPRPVCAKTLLMLPQPAFHIVSMAGVIGAIAATQKVNPVVLHQPPGALRLRSGRAMFVECNQAAAAGTSYSAAAALSVSTNSRMWLSSIVSGGTTRTTLSPAATVSSPLVRR